MTAKEFKQYNKYLVLKISDIHLFLTETQKINLGKITTQITLGRIALGKSSPNYIVVNQNEPYAEEVWKLIKKQWEIEQDEQTNL